MSIFVPTHVGMAGIFGNIHAADGAVLDQRHGV